MENKTSKYFKYAIGEIVLVVIGILIALQVNNWNNARLDSKKEQFYLLNLKRDLIKQADAIQYNISGENIVKTSLGKALDTYHENKGFIVNTENLINIAPINDRYTFNISNPTYTEILSTGNLGIISDIQFKNNLMEYYAAMQLTSQIIQNNNTQKDNAVLFNSLSTLEPYGPNVNYDNPTVRGSFDNYQTPDYILDLIKQALNEPKNELALFNSIRYRINMAHWHINKLEWALELTQKLIEQIDD